MRTTKANQIGIRAGIPATIAVMFAFVWLGVYVVGLSNSVNTGGLGLGSLGEMIPLIAGIPILLLSLSKTFSLTAIGIGVAALVGLFFDSVILQSPTVSGQIITGLQTLTTSSTLTYQTTPQSLVATIGAFAIAEEAGFGMFLRHLADSVFGIAPGQPNYVLKGVIVSLTTVGPFFDVWHIFVTVPAYSTLLNAPPVFGVFNIAILLSPFSISAIIARTILDTSNRISRDYISGIVGHAGFDMLITGHALGLF